MSLCLLWVHTARADEARCELRVDEKNVQVTSMLPIMSNGNSETMRKVRDGLALTLDFQFKFGSRSAREKAATLFRCHVLYDLWGEKYIVSRSDEDKAKIYPLGREHDALKQCMTYTTSASSDVTKVDVEAVLNPVDEKQQELTREWLATKGLGGSSVVGRAIGAVMNLKAEKRWTYECAP